MTAPLWRAHSCVPCWHSCQHLLSACLRRVGQQAMQRSAHVDAIRNLTSAIDLLRKLPDSPARIHRELVLQLVLGSALFAVKGWAAPEAGQAYTRARKLCGELGNPAELFPVLYGLWAVHFLRIELRAAYKLAEQLLQAVQDALSSEPERLPSQPPLAKVT